MPNQSGTYATPRLDLGVAMWEYSQESAGFVGTKILPQFKVTRKAANFSKITRESTLRRVNVKRAARAAYSRDTFDAEDQGYSCEERGHEAPLDDSERTLYVNDFDAEVASSKIAMLRVLREQEIDIAQAVFNTTTWDTGNAALYTDVATVWSNIAADIIGDVLAAKEKVRANTGMDPNAAIFSKAVLVQMMKNTGIREALHYTSFPALDALLKALGPLFGVDNIHVAGGVYNAAKEGQAFSGTDIWSSSYAMLARVAAEGESIETPCLGRTFQWIDDCPDSSGVMVEEYREEQTRSNIYRARSHSDEVIFDAVYGHLLKID